jgi:hypothetical protein
MTDGKERVTRIALRVPKLVFHSECVERPRGELSTAAGNARSAATVADKLSEPSDCKVGGGSLGHVLVVIAPL